MFSICFINQKGGCGKSSTCFHLSGFFAHAGFKVLLIDADPQGSLSQGFFGSVLIENLPAVETLAALFEDSVVSPLGLPVPTSFSHIAIVRANHTLARHNIPAPENSGLRQFVLRSLLEEIEGHDIALIDCPPNLYQCSWNALLAADFVVVPVPPEDFAIHGLRTIHQAVAQAQRLNPRLQLLGYLVTRFDQRLLVHRSYEQKLRSLHGEHVLTTVIPEATAFKVALACRQPVGYCNPRSKAALGIDTLGLEILSRMELSGFKRRVA